MEMFWRKRLEREEDQAGWALPFGDLMALLLAVFIMIAAMSEWHSGQRFQAVAGGVRTAFGFGSRNLEGSPLPTPGTPMTLIERLERARLGVVSDVRLGSVTGQEPAFCRMVVEREGLRLMLLDEACFEPLSAVLKPAGRQFVTRLAEYLTDGASRIRLVVLATDETLPAEVALRDGWDLGYERARGVAGLLVVGGVARDRLAVELCGDPAGRHGGRPLQVEPGGEAAGRHGGRPLRVESGGEPGTDDPAGAAEAHHPLEIIVEAEPTARATDRTEIAGGT